MTQFVKAEAERVKQKDSWHFEVDGIDRATFLLTAPMILGDRDFLCFAFSGFFFFGTVYLLHRGILQCFFFNYFFLQSHVKSTSQEESNTS